MVDLASEISPWLPNLPLQTTRDGDASRGRPSMPAAARDWAAGCCAHDQHALDDGDHVVWMEGDLERGLHPTRVPTRSSWSPPLSIRLRDPTRCAARSLRRQSATVSASADPPRQEIHLATARCRDPAADERGDLAIGQPDDVQRADVWNQNRAVPADGLSNAQQRELFGPGRKVRHRVDHKRDEILA